MFYILRKESDTGKTVELIGAINLPERKHVYDYLNDPNTLYYLPFCIHGETYAERKESLHDLAVEYSYAPHSDADADENLSIYESSCVSRWFEKNGKKYGLLKEFRENCIC